jgi:predicted transcriptional regulator of viral defense system
MYENFINIINKNNGIITAKEAENKGISRMDLKKMTDNGLIERIEYGIYATDKFIYDEYYLFQLKHKNTIFSYNTALYFYNMTERTPIKMDVTTKRSTNLSAYKDKINLYRVSDDIIKIGITKMKTPYGNTIISYNMERTVCDIINNKSNIDIETANKAIKNCIKSKEFNASRMFEYAKKMNIYDKVKNYMEAII